MNELDLFAAAIAIADPKEREALLDREYADQPQLRHRLDQLLAAHFQSNPLLDAPAAEQSADHTPSSERTISTGPAAEAVGTVIASRYKLLEEIGVGGMGTVWVAEQTQPVRRKVALKLIKAGMDLRSVLARFEAERQALALMDHPNVAKVLDGGLTQAGRPFFVMEYVKGVPITEYCDSARLSVPDRLQLFTHVCHALQHAHQKGIIHHDLKPSNVLVAPYDDKPVPKIIDFGLAKAIHQSLTERTLHTAHEAVLGTPLYMSPEQAQLNNLDVDTRSDIYSLGVLLYELLTGTTPVERLRFREAAWDEIRRIIREEEPPRPSTRLSSIDSLPSVAVCRQTEPSKLTKQVRGELAWIVMKALEKDRTRRYETANGFAADVQRYLAGEPVQAMPPSSIYRLRKFARKNRATIVAVSLILLTLLGGIIGTSLGLFEAERKARDADAAAEQARVAQGAEKQARKEADRGRKNAESKAEESRRRLIQLHAGNGVRAIEEGDTFGGLVWFAEALRLDRGILDREQVHRRRLAALFRQGPRLLQVYTHQGVGETDNLRVGVGDAQFSPDGRRVVTASRDGTARVWDVATGAPLTPPMEHSSLVWKASFSSDGRYVLTQSGGTGGGNEEAQVWDAATGRPVSPPLPHTGWLKQAIFSPDGRRVATATLHRSRVGGEARVWEVATGEPVTPPLKHDHEVSSLTFFSDGARLITGSWDPYRGEPSVLRVWDVATGKPAAPPWGQDAAVYCAVFSPDGSQVVTSSGETARVWNTATQAAITPPMRVYGWIWTLMFSPDGQRILTTSGSRLLNEEREVRVWDATTGEPIGSAYHPRSVGWRAAFGPDGRPTVSGGWSGEWRVGGTQRTWWTTTLVEDRPLVPPLMHGDRISSGALSPDGHKVVTSGWDGTARVWDAAGGLAAFPPVNHGEALTAVAMSPDGRRLLTAGWAGTARVWDVATGIAVTQPMRHAAGVTAATFSPDGARVVSASYDGTARVWDAATGAPVSKTVKHHFANVLNACFSPDGNRVLTTAGDSPAGLGGEWILWEAATGQVVAGSGRQEWPMKHGAFSPDGRKVVTASNDSAGRVWDAETGRLLLPPLKHTSNYLEWAEFSPDGRRLGTAGLDGTGRVWDAATGAPIAILKHASMVNHISFSPVPGENRVLTASWDGTARIWDSATGKPLSAPMRHGNGVARARFNSDGRLTRILHVKH
jgi:WD40 repeat protein/serine/threonine protein kinase